MECNHLSRANCYISYVNKTRLLTEAHWYNTVFLFMAFMVESQIFWKRPIPRVLRA